MKYFLLLILCFFSFLPISFEQVIYPLTGHPRLFFLQADEAVLKNKIDNTPGFDKVHKLIIAESDKMINLPVQQLVLTGRRLLSVSREAIRRISFLSYAYRMTADTKYAYTICPDQRWTYDKTVLGYSVKDQQFNYVEWVKLSTGKVLERELYDHANDPKETKNVIDNPEYASVIAELAKRCTVRKVATNHDYAFKNLN